MRGGLGRGRWAFTALLVVASVVGAGPLPAGAADFIPPVDAPVTRGFQEPAHDYGQGHRGIDFDLPVGTEVVASAAGVVQFAGPVARSGEFVSISHAAGLTTISSFLSVVTVRAGQRVRQGEVIGRSGDGHPREGRPGLHFAVKIGDRYVDPVRLFAMGLDDYSELLRLAPVDQGSSDSSAEAVPEARTEPPPSAALPVATAPQGTSELRAEARSPSPAEKPATSHRKPESSERVERAGAGPGLGALLGAARALAPYIGRAIRTGLQRLRQAASAAAESAVMRLRNGASMLSEAGGWLWREGHAIAREGKPLDRLLDRLQPGLSSVRQSPLLKVAGSVNKFLQVGWLFVGAYQGAGEQAVCQDEGGVLPRIPTRAERKAGATAPPPPNDNIVIAVAGLGSSTTEQGGTITPHATMYEMDLQTLGYSADSVFHFSYRGIEDRGGTGPYRLHAAYGKQDTHVPIQLSAKRLKAQIAEIHRRYPNKKIDIVAHSQGGVVAQYYVEFLYDPDHVSGVRLDHLVTIGSPHGGDELARLGPELSDGLVGAAKLKTLNVLAGAFGAPPPGSPAAMQLGTGSSFMQELRQGWDPMKVRATTIASAFDPVVTSDRSRLEGADTFTIASLKPMGPLSAHSSVVEAAKPYVYNALANRRSPCTALWNKLADHGSAAWIAGQEALLILVLDHLWIGSLLP